MTEVPHRVEVISGPVTLEEFLGVKISMTTQSLVTLKLNDVFIKTGYTELAEMYGGLKDLNPLIKAEENNLARTNQALSGLNSGNKEFAIILLEREIMEINFAINKCFQEGNTRAVRHHSHNLNVLRMLRDDQRNQNS